MGNFLQPGQPKVGIDAGRRSSTRLGACGIPEVFIHIAPIVVLFRPDRGHCQFFSLAVQLVSLIEFKLTTPAGRWCRSRLEQDGVPCRKCWQWVSSGISVLMYRGHRQDCSPSSIYRPAEPSIDQALVIMLALLLPWHLRLHRDRVGIIGPQRRGRDGRCCHRRGRPLSRCRGLAW
jgi:hypothetical protein